MSGMGYKLGRIVGLVQTLELVCRTSRWHYSDQGLTDVNRNYLILFDSGCLPQKRLG